MYRVVTGPDAADQIAALPSELLPVYLQVLDMLELTPWNGESYNASNPDAAMRHLSFGPDGRGIVIYLVLEEQRRIYIPARALVRLDTFSDLRKQRSDNRYYDRSTAVSCICCDYSLFTAQGSLRQFCDYVADPRYQWTAVCERLFGTHPAQICFEWNTAVHAADHEVSATRGPTRAAGVDQT